MARFRRPRHRPQPPLLAFLSALMFAGSLAWTGVSISPDSLLLLCCGSVPVAFGLTWLWIDSGQDPVQRTLPVLCLSITIAIGSLSWTILPGNWLVLTLLTGGAAFVSYRLLERFLGSMVEVLWAFRLPGRPHISELETWRNLLYTREALTGDLTERAVIEKLQQDGSEQSAHLLAIAVTDHPDPEVRRLALHALDQLTRRGAIDTVCAVWAQTRHNDLAELLSRKKWRASSPPEVLILSALLLGDVDFLRKSRADQIRSLAQACLDADPLIAKRAADAIRSLENFWAQEALWRLVMKAGNPVAEAAILASSYLPRNERERALFLFLGEQWERYAAHDFDRRLMHLIYVSGTEPLRQRIRDKLRTAGRMDFLPIIAREDSDENTFEFNAAESEVLVQTLIANHNWEVLWRHVLDLPIQGSVQAVAALSLSDWKPTTSHEQALFAELAALVADGLQTEVSLPLEPIPLITMQAMAHVPGRINTFSFSPVGSILAVGTEHGKVIIWNYRTRQRGRVLENFRHAITAVAFNRRGFLFCAERSRPNPSSIYAFPNVLDNDRSFEVGTHDGSLTALVPMDGGYLLSGEYGSVVSLWNMNIAGRGVIRRREILHDSLRVSPNENRLLVLRGSLQLLSLRGLEDIAQTQEDDACRCATFAPDQETIFAGTSSGRLLVYRGFEQDRLVAGTIPITDRPEAVEAVEVLRRRSLLLTAGTSGEIRFFSLDGYRQVGGLTVPDGQITALQVSPDESLLAVSSAGKTLTFWDLDTMNAQPLLDRPFAQAEPTMISSLNALLNHSNLSPRTRRVLQFANAILHYRFRFAIEVSEAPKTAFREFDIEID